MANKRVQDQANNPQKRNDKKNDIDTKHWGMTRT